MTKFFYTLFLFMVQNTNDLVAGYNCNDKIFNLELYTSQHKCPIEETTYGEEKMLIYKYDEGLDYKLTCKHTSQYMFWEVLPYKVNSTVNNNTLNLHKTQKINVEFKLARLDNLTIFICHSVFDNHTCSKKILFKHKPDFKGHYVSPILTNDHILQAKHSNTTVTDCDGIKDTVTCAFLKYLTRSSSETFYSFEVKRKLPTFKVETITPGMETDKPFPWIPVAVGVCALVVFVCLFVCWMLIRRRIQTNEKDKETNPEAKVLYAEIELESTGSKNLKLDQSPYAQIVGTLRPNSEDI